MIDPSFTVSLIRAGLEGFSGLTATRLLERTPSAAELADFESWRVHARTRISELIAALELGSPAAFGARVAWSRDAFVSRNHPLTNVSAAVDALHEVLQESLPDNAWSMLPPYFDEARRVLASPAQPTKCMLDSSEPSGQLALEYVAALRAGDESRAIALVMDAAVTKRVTVHAALHEVLLRSLRELGRLWHRGELTIAEEHHASAVTRRLIERLLASAQPAIPNGKKVVVTAVAGDAHDMGVSVVAAFFELAGWRAICLGADTPAEDLVRIVARFDADLVALGATLDSQREAARRMIAALREERPKQRIIVGGAAFNADREAWKRVGADALAASPHDAVAVGTKLTSQA